MYLCSMPIHRDAGGHIQRRGSLKSVAICADIGMPTRSICYPILGRISFLRLVIRLNLRVQSRSSPNPTGRCRLSVSP